MSDQQKPTSGKGRPTPTRKEREAANLKPIVGGPVTAETRKADRAKIQAERLKAREGMMRGDDRYLGPRDKGPQRRLARDVVDSKLFTIGELLIPSMIVVILLGGASTTIAVVANLSLWILLMAMIVDSLLLARKAKRLISKKYGAPERGTSWYVFMRALQLRPMRLPKAQVKRGTKLTS